MAKKRTGLDALREYEARSGRQTQSEAQTEGSSGGAWRSGLDALRQFEANGGGQNVKNGPYNPNYRTMTRAMEQEAYERYKRAVEAQERYSRAADTMGNSPVGGYLRAMQQRQPQGRAAKTIEHDQQSGYRRTREVKSAQVQPTIEHDQQSGYLRTLRMKGSAEYLTQSQEDPAWETVRQDQARGGKRTQYELQRQIEQFEKARDYALSMQAGDPEGLPELRGAYEAVNAGRTKPMTLTEMDEALREMKVKKQNAATLADEAMTAQELERKKDAIYALAFYPEEWTPEQKQAARGILETQRGGSGIFGGMDRASYAFAPYIEAVRSGNMDRADEWDQIYNMLYSRLFEKTTAVTEGFAEGLGLRSAEKVIGAATGAENPAWEAYMRSVQVAKAQNPALSAAGQIAGSLALMGGISKGVGAASGALIGKKAAQLGTLGRTALSMGQSALTFAAREAIQGAGAAATGEKTGGAYAQDILASGAGGAAGALVSGLISTNMADWLRKTGNSKPFWEFVRQSASAYAFSGTSVATSAMLGSEKKSANEIATELGTAFLFSLVSGYMNTMRETKMASAAVEQKYETISQQLDAIGKHLDGGRKFRTEEEFTQAVEDLRRTVQGLKADVQGTYYAGQQDFVNQMVAALDRIDYNLLSMLPGADAGAAAASAVSTAAAGAGGVAAAEAQKLMQEASAALAEGAQGVPPAPVQPGDAGGKGAAAAAQALTEGMTPEQTQKRIQDAFGTTAAEQAVQVPPAQPTMPVPPDVAAEAEAAQREANFQAYSRYAEERDARARDAEEVSQVRAQEYTEAINDAEADAADAAFEKLNKAEVSGALDAQARWQAEDARAERQFEVESREDTDRALSEAAQRYGYDERMTRVLLSGYSGAQSTQQYAEAVNAAYEYGKSGMSRTAAQRAAQGIDKALADEAWSAGKEIANGEKAGAARIDDGGKRNAGMDSGKPVGAVAGSAGGTAARSAAGRAVAERIGLENRVSAAGQPYLSGKDIGLSKGSAQRSFREAPESTWTDGMKAAAGTLKSAGFADVHFTVGSISVENQRAKVTRYADGVAAGNSVWVNATAKKWSVQQLADHEAFHRQVQDTPGLLDSVRAVLADELGDSGIRELAQRYAEAYEGCYDGEELDAYIEEICADAYAGMDRFPEEKAKIIQKAARQAQDAQQAAEENGKTRGPPEKYSVGTSTDGTPVAIVDNDILSHIDTSTWDDAKKAEAKTAAKDALLSFKDGFEVAGVDYKVNRTSRREYTRSNDTERLYRKSTDAFADKMRSAEIADDIITATTAWARDGRLKHQRTDSFVDFLHGDVLIQAGDNQYIANTVVGVTENGEYVFYDVVDMTPTSFQQKTEPSTTASGSKAVSDIQESSDTNSIRSPEPKSQEKFSADGSTATPQENDKAALAYFGRTYKWSETGYVLLNGARLDFSGRHEGGSGGYRSVDHRDIVDALGEDYGGGDYSGGMVRFMQEGNIRISPESGGINLAVMPTKAQMDSLSDFISKERGEVILDIDDARGNTISSTEYPRGTHANKVLQDIRNYFNDGTMPEVSDSPTVGQFRYSVAEEAAESDTEAEGSELQVEKLPQANRDQFMRFATKITDDLVTPLTAQMETLRKEMRPRVLELVDEFLENDALKRSSVEAVFEEAYDRALELNREFSEKYATLQYTIRKTPVTFTEEDTRQIEQYDYFDEAALRKLTIKEKGGASIGELYSDLSGMLPELFPSGIKNPAKQIMRIASVYKRISKAQALAQQVDSTNPEYFRENAYNEFLEQLRKIVPKMRTERELAQISIEEEAKMEAYMAERERRIAEEDARLAEEEAAKAPPEVFESMTMDSIPKKAQDYLRRVRGQTAAAIQQTLSMPFAARQEVLKPAIEEMMNEYLQTGRISQETVDRSFEESYRRGVEMDTEFYDEYKDVKTRLRDLKVTLSETDRADIADFDDFRRAASGRLRIANEGGLPVDTAYNQMREMAPELFPASVTHPADQLMQMFEVSKRIERVQRSLDEFHGAEAEEFKRWAKNDYEASVENMLGSLRVARRYAEARMRQKQARAVPTTLDEVKGLYADLKKLRRTYERAASKNLLTAEDNNVLNRLLRGDLAPEDVQGMENAKGILAMYEAKADYDATAAKIADWRRYQKAQRLAVADAALKNADQAKDKAAGIQYSRETMTRNVRDIFPEADAEIINRTYFEPVRTASANANKLKNQLREQVKALDLSRKARKGDAVSEAHAVQLLGEAQDNIRYLEQHPRAQDRDGKTLNEWRQIVLDLWATSPGLDRAKIENAVETFRKIYDGLFEQMNDVRIRNGYEPINYRQGYFPHFQPGTTDGILGLMGKALGIDAEVSALPTTISGLTHTFKPGITYFGNALERIGFDTAYDAVEGFDKYVEGAASVICYTDVIQNLRALAQQVRYRTSDEGLRERVDDVRARDDLTEHQKELEIKEIMDKGRFSLSNFAIELDEYTNLLANKKSKYDRGIESLAGRKVYNLLKAWENRVAANMVAVNPASWLTNFGVITQAGAELRTTSVLKAMGQTLKGWTKDDGFVERSDFLVNRRGSDPLVRTWQQSASAVLSKPMDWIDTFSADTIVRARYMENIARGMSEEEAMREADDFAANVMADRSKGAMPTMFESRNPIFKMFTQFQLEVNNTFSYLFKDLPRDMRKKGMFALAYALFKFLIGGYIYNEVYEHFIGRRPMLDPLGIVNDTVGDLTGYELNNLVDAAAGGGLIKESEPESAIGTVQNLAKNVGQEAPFIGNLMGGGKLPFSSSMPNVKNILTALDSETATDEEKLAKVGKELINPAAYWLLPFGGGQIKKVWQGLSALKRQGSYTADGRLQYPIYTDRKGDMASAVARTMLFGKSATPEAQAWVEAGFGALSKKATQTYEAMREAGVDQRDSYELIKAMSKIKKTDDATAKDLKMQMLLSFDIEDSGKVLYYYNMMASDKERAQIDKLLEAGADVGEYLRYIQAAAGVTGEKGADGKTISGSVRDETLQLIDGLDLTPEQKTALAADSYTLTGFEPWTENHDRLYKAVSTGKDLRSTLKELEKAGYEPKEIRAAITEMFREEYLAADKAGKARLKGYLRNAFMACGLSKKEAENKIKKWEEAQK